MTEPRRPQTPADLLGGRYRLRERLGRGGTATVYRATDEVLRREVAVKVLEIVREDAEIAAERFRREALATAALSHPNIVTVFDSGVDDERPYIVMELLPGATLADELRDRGPFPIDEVRAVALQVCDALDAAHAAGLVHRDIKPGNIARAETGEIKVLDFGIAQIVDEVLAGHAPLTVTGAVLGTSTYLAPEQGQGGRVDHRADLYALGCVLYALLTGQPPYKGPTLVATLLAHLTDPVPDVHALRPDVPPSMAAVVTAMLAKNADDRPQSAAEVAAALKVDDEAATVPLPAARPAPVAGGGLAMVAPWQSMGDEPTGTFAVDAVEEPQERRDRRVMLIPAAIALVVVGSIGAALLLNQDDAGEATGTPPTAAQTTSIAPPSAPAAEPSPSITRSASPSPSPTASPSPSPSASASASAGPSASAVPSAQPSPIATEPTSEPAPTTAAPVPSTPTPAPPASTTVPVTAPPPQPAPVDEPTTEAPPEPAPQPVPVDGSSVQAAADQLSSAVQDATTSGNFDKQARKEIDASLRDLSRALREGDDQGAANALSAVDQTLSRTGQRAAFDPQLSSLRDAVAGWQRSL